MSRFHSYLQSATRIIRAYDGTEPLASFLKKFFAQDKKFGSRDRKSISSIVYCYYRTGHALGKELTDRSLLQALFLCGSSGQDILAELAPEWMDKLSLPARERLAVMGLKPLDLFPFSDLLSTEINAEDYCLSLLAQPDLFLRMRPGKEQIVYESLSKAGLSYTDAGGSALRLDNQSPLDGILALNRDAVIQDLSSQQVLDGMFPAWQTDFSKAPVHAWDCCAASGGKAILLYDTLKGHVNITISDIRKSILQNASGRLREASVPIQRSFLADLTEPDSMPKDVSSQLILADMPCTGSGTWSRTPEQAFFFNPKSLDELVQRQRKIVQHVSTKLQPGGTLLYITCSVFTAENEELLAESVERAGLKISDQKYYVGINLRADTLFSAVCRSALTE